MAEETMKDFDKEINESLNNMKSYEDPDGGQWEVFQKMMDEKTVSKVKITEVVKGGCIAFLEEVRGFIPASQLAVGYVEDLNDYLGKHLDVVIITADPVKKRLVLSHRVIEQESAREEKAKRMSALKPGDVLEGKVESLKDYGAFIDLGDGLSGLLHISQISHNRIKHPSVVLKEGDTVQVKVLDIKDGKISLSKRALEENTGFTRESSDNFKYEERGAATTSMASLLKDIKID